MCESVNKNKACLKRDKCEYCHTHNEYSYHPDRWKHTKCNKDSCTIMFCPDKHEGEIVLSKENYKKVFEEVGVECDRVRERLYAYKSVEKDWVCLKCKNVICSPKDIVVYKKFILCKMCQEIFDVECEG
eukprot:TRINITY_DN9407_c0_g1_i1.p1 TRINITY_DN9407_c0_g1~~TRINITY_DN9407_c0_g1_i1.p1  ORF type:complete len:129 (-),score=26.67 TRINITY_DN9407_c0_g1_i1:126-512(-)